MYGMPRSRLHTSFFWTGHGHLNCRSNIYVIRKLFERGFSFHYDDTFWLRARVSTSAGIACARWGRGEVWTRGLRARGREKEKERETEREQEKERERESTRARARLVFGIACERRVRGGVGAGVVRSKRARETERMRGRKRE